MRGQHVDIPEPHHSAIGDDETLASTKLPPLDSQVKAHQGHDHYNGVIGDEELIESIHIPPFPEHLHPEAKKYAQKHGSSGSQHHARHHEAQMKHDSKLAAEQMKDSHGSRQRGQQSMGMSERMKHGQRQTHGGSDHHHEAGMHGAMRHGHHGHLHPHHHHGAKEGGMGKRM